MVDGQVAHTPTSYHKYYHLTNFFVTSLVTYSPSLCTCLSTITSMTSAISPTTYLYYCHHSHQHQYSFYSPTMSLTSFVSSLEIFHWQNQKSLHHQLMINQRSDFGSLPARVPVQLLVPPPHEQHPALVRHLANLVDQRTQQNGNHI